MNLRILSLFSSMLLCAITGYSINYPTAVEKVLIKAGKNRTELEKVIVYYKKKKDPLKLRAAYFLISNMDCHSSANYYWADQNNKKIPFNEFSYPDFTAAEKAAADIKIKNPGARMLPENISDVTSLKADFLIDHINRSFVAWRKSPIKGVTFESFCEYILPYRASVEPVQAWMPTYTERFKYFDELLRINGLNNSLAALRANFASWFTDTYDLESRREPLPRLGSMQLLFRKKGPCEDIADLSTFIFRSQGIPVALDIVPFWGTSTGSHFSTAIFDSKHHITHFDLSKTVSSDNVLSREPPKVIRITYAKQTGTLADIENPANIPDGFMQTVNYKDVTPDYWPTANLTCKLYPAYAKGKIAYSCILNGLRWRPTWWGKINNGTVTFEKMGKGIVYVPECYRNGKLIPAGSPVALGYHHEMILTPDFQNRTKVIIKQEAGYINFKFGRKYRLYFWNDRWLPIGQQVAAMTTTQMEFTNVPKHSLLVLIPEYSKRKERPFMITDDGKRTWF